MLTVPVTITATQSAKHEGTNDVHRDNHSPPIEPICRRPAKDAEQQGRKVLAEESH
jgi:hypothetical protein